MDGGRQVGLDAAGRLFGINLPLPQQQAVEEALQTGQVAPPAGVTRLIGRRGRLAGSTNQERKFTVIRPVGTAVISQRPAFSWQPLAGANSYIVSVFNERFEKILSSPPLHRHDWTPASSLQREQTYLWHVTAQVGGDAMTVPVPPDPEARFRVLGASEVADLERGLETSRGSHLIRGVLYARAGVLDEAEEQFRALAHENPASEVAARLLRILEAIRSGSESPAANSDRNLLPASPDAR
jgi:hypothetical protein